MPRHFAEHLAAPGDVRERPPAAPAHASKRGPSTFLCAWALARISKGDPPAPPTRLNAHCGAAAEDDGSDDDAVVDECRVNLCIAVDQGGSTTQDSYSAEMENIERLINNLKKSDGNQFLSLIGYSDTAKPLEGATLSDAFEASSTLAKSDKVSFATSLGQGRVRLSGELVV